MQAGHLRPPREGLLPDHRHLFVRHVAIRGELDRFHRAPIDHIGAHLLLGRSLEDIASRRPGLLRPALTARAIAVDEDLPGGARGAFGRIVAVVEQALWARRAIDAGDWTDARASYEDFAFGPHWRRAA